MARAADQLLEVDLVVAEGGQRLAPRGFQRGGQVPFKVRRFNWFNYSYADTSLNLVLNPDVAVRTRGIMEKCSMCVQRIHEGKLQAKKAGIPLPDHAIKTACEQSCPTQAIVFGDMNDKNSEAAKLAASGRNYVLLGELNVKPSIQYLAKVRNSGEV